MFVVRSLIYMLWLIVTTVPWAVFVLVLSLFLKPYWLYRVCQGWLLMAIGGARWICGVRWRIQGIHHLPAPDSNQPIILCAKHQSTWETFALPLLMPRHLAFVFKQELLLIPFFGWAMSRLDMVHIDRKNTSKAWQKVVDQGQLLMSKGLWVIMFPEGTRTARGTQGKYKLGAARLALTTQASLVPIAITSGRCWPRRSFILRSGTIDISIGPPIAPHAGSAEVLMADAENWIETEMRRLDPHAYD